MNIIAKIKNLVKCYEKELVLALCLILTAGVGFNIGYIHASHQKDNFANNQSTQNVLSPSPTPNQRVVVSKSSSSKVYHYSWCSGARNISAKNQIWFPTSAAAEAAGYTLASNCKP